MFLRNLHLLLKKIKSQDLPLRGHHSGSQLGLPLPLETAAVMLLVAGTEGDRTLVVLAEVAVRPNQLFSGPLREGVGMPEGYQHSCQVDDMVVTWQTFRTQRLLKNRGLVTSLASYFSYAQILVQNFTSLDDDHLIHNLHLGKIETKNNKREKKIDHKNKSKRALFFLCAQTNLPHLSQQHPLRRPFHQHKGRPQLPEWSVHL